MEDLEVLEQSKLNIFKEVDKILNDLKIELKSKSGLISNKINFACGFNYILSLTIKCLKKDLENIFLNYNSTTIQNYKDKFINTFMILHHEFIVKPLKYNSNWD